MKLSAQISSERGKTIQKTGNEYLKIEVQDENRNMFLCLMINIFSDGINCSYHLNENIAYIEEGEPLKKFTK